MATSNIVKLKRGDSFVFTNNQLIGDDGNPLDLNGWGIRSQIRNKSLVLVEELIVVVSQFDYSITADPLMSSSWPVGDLMWDIEYTTPDGVVFSSDTIIVKIIQDITF